MFTVRFGLVLGENLTEPNQSVCRTYHPFDFDFSVEPNQTKPVRIGSVIWFFNKILEAKITSLQK